jgi:PAS domain S-box-containing protein
MQEEEQSRLRQLNAELENLVRTLQAKLPKCDDATLPKAFAPSLLNGNQTHKPKMLSSGVHSELHLSQARYAAIVEDHPDPICCFLPDGTLVDGNEACCCYFDRTRSTLLGDNFWELVAYKPQPGVSLDGSTIKRYDHPKVTEDGQINWQQWTIRAIRDLQNCVVEFQAIGRNRTDLKKTSLRSDESSSLAQISRLESTIAQLQVEVMRRDRAQEALREAMQRLTFHVDNSPLAIIEWDRSLKVMRWSREAETLFGWHAEEVLGRQFGSWSFVFPEDMEMVNGTIATLLNGEATRNVCYHRNLTQAGVIVHCEWYNSVLFDESGQLISILSLAQNITQRKKTEEALQRQNLRSQLFADVTLKIRQSLHLEEILQTTVTEVRSLLQADRVLIHRLSLDGTGTVTREAVSPGWNSLIGRTYPTDILLPRHAKTNCRSMVQSVEDIEQEDSPTADFLRSIHVRARLVVPIVQQDCLWGLLVAHQGNPRQWSSSEIELFQQLSNQVEIALTQSQLLHALRESEERFRTMANSAPVLLWMLDPAGNCVFCNESLLKFTGCTIDPDGSLNWYEIVHPLDRAYCEATCREALTHHSSFEIEYRLRRADGAYRWVLDRGVPRLMPDGSFGGHIGSCIDITDRKQAEVEIRKALDKERELSELKSRFVSTASHEFRTPLSTILSSADLLEFYAGGWTPEKQIEHIQRIQNAALNMNNLLNDILIIERAEAKKLNFEPVPIDLFTFCRSLIDEIQLNDQENHRVILEVQDWKLKPQTAHMDEKLLRQIFSNLLSNAIKYSPSSSSIVFRLTYEADRAIFEVQDQGIGIPFEDQSRLFEPFHRGMNVGTISGDGLGLAIVKQSIEMHQGQISVYSQEGAGTMMRVVLPLQTIEVLKNDYPLI